MNTWNAQIDPRRRGFVLIKVDAIFTRGQAGIWDLSFQLGLGRCSKASNGRRCIVRFYLSKGFVGCCSFFFSFLFMPAGLVLAPWARGGALALDVLFDGAFVLCVAWLSCSARPSFQFVVYSWCSVLSPRWSPAI